MMSGLKPFFVANQDAKLLLSIDVSGHDAWIRVGKLRAKKGKKQLTRCLILVP